MAPVDQLNDAEASLLLGADCHHAPVPLRRVPGARLLWINSSLIARDPRFVHLRGDVSACSRYVLDACSFVTTEADTASASCDALGYADRYGGRGIGRNGGSGRSVIINGFLVKGIGRTPLVSPLTAESHASGHAYLEESIRETIYAELVAAEFPAGAVATLAIIDTGLTWSTDSGNKPERRMLLVRPCFVRPAHFERAASFLAGRPKEGAQDAARVRRFFDTAIALWGREGLEELYRTFWHRWAAQLAYGFVHRLSQGGTCTSNVCLDGKLVDFGGMTALPSWARATTVPARQVCGDEFRALARAIESLSYYFGRYVDTKIAAVDAVRTTIANCRKSYLRTLTIEVLRLCGLRRCDAERVVDDDSREASMIVASLLKHYQRERYDVIESTPEPRIAWDIPLLWASHPPRHLLRTRALMDAAVSGSDQSAAAERCRFRSRSRVSVYREEAKQEMYRALEISLAGERLDAPSLTHLIDARIVNARRDCQVEPESAVPAGFARGQGERYALFRCLKGGGLFAVPEEETAGNAATVARRLPVQSCSAESLELPGAVRLVGVVA
jgi:hypothetical protein